MNINRHRIIILSLCLAAVIAAIGGTIYYVQSHGRENKIRSTDRVGYAEFEIPYADSLIVGKWQDAANPHQYKVYYDDYDEDAHLFWGKEWDEAEDVFEEDLNYHGNGWFRWEKRGKVLHEYATMDARDVFIHHAYRILFSSADSLSYCDAEHKHIISSFTRIQ